MSKVLMFIESAMVMLCAVGAYVMASKGDIISSTVLLIMAVCSILVSEVYMIRSDVSKLHNAVIELGYRVDRLSDELIRHGKEK